MKKREIIETVIATVILLVIVTLLAVIPATREAGGTTTEATEALGSERKQTEATTEARTEEKTEKTVPVYCETSAAPEEVKRAKRKREEATEEQSTGEVNADGYGWVQLQYSATYHITENHLTRSNGVVYFAGHRETWYSTNEAAGKATAWEIPDKHVAEDGTIRDKDGFVCVASSDHPKHTIIMTSVGVGKVYDTGCSHGTIDVYTTW